MQGRILMSAPGISPSPLAHVYINHQGSSETDYESPQSPPDPGVYSELEVRAPTPPPTVTSRSNPAQDVKTKADQRRMTIRIVLTALVTLGLCAAGFVAYHFIAGRGGQIDSHEGEVKVTVTATDSVPVSCTKPTFVAVPSQTVASATLVTGPVSLATCLGVCAADTTCVAVVMSGEECSVVRDGLDLTTSDASAVLWRYQTTCRRNDSVCDFDYHGEYYVGDAAVSVQLTMGGCVASCMEDARCVAFSYSGEREDCRVVTTPSDPNHLMPMGGYVLYRSLACGHASVTPSGACGSHYYQEFANTHQTGGRGFHATTQQTCADLCTQDISCIGFDFASGRCYLHDKGLGVLEPQQWASHFRYHKDCPNRNGQLTCVFDYQGPYDARAFEHSTDTLDQCMIQCADDERCRAISYGNKRCRVVLSETDLMARTDNDDLLMYRRLNCSGAE